MQYILSFVLTVVIVGAINWRNASREPSQTIEGQFRIAPGKKTAAFTVAGGLGMAALGAYAYVNVGQPSQQNDNGIFLVVMILGIAISAFMAPSLTHWHDVIWDRASVEGPANMFGPTLGWRRHRVLWRDVARLGHTVTGYDYLETHDGRRIYWSYLYPGYKNLENKVKKLADL